MFKARGSIQVIAASAVLLVGIGAQAVALAAHPKPGRRYAGFTSEPKAAGFRAPVSFTVSTSGRSLRSFRYSSLGCFGGIGVRPGVNVFTKPIAIHRLGSLAVSGNGTFGAHRVNSTYARQAHMTVTTTTVTGKFTTATTATGTIRFTQTSTGPQMVINRCGPTEFSFSARTG